MLEFIKTWMFPDRNFEEYQWADRILGTWGNKESIWWLHNQGMKITSNTLKGAIQGGHYDTAKWIIDLGIKPDSYTIDYIIGDDQFDWLIATIPSVISSECYDYAIKCSNISAIKKLVSLGIPLTIDGGFFPLDVAVVNCLIDLKINPNETQIRFMVLNRDPSLVYLLYEKGFFIPNDEYLIYLIGCYDPHNEHRSNNNILEIIIWAHSVGVIISVDQANKALDMGAIKLLDYFAKSGVRPCPKAKPSNSYITDYWFYRNNFYQ